MLKAGGHLHEFVELAPELLPGIGLGLGSTFLIGAFFGAWPAWKRSSAATAAH